MSLDVAFETVENRCFVEVHPVASSMQQGWHGRKPVLRTLSVSEFEHS